jgi:hypothetical protein
MAPSNNRPTRPLAHLPPVPPGYTYDTLPVNMKLNMWTIKSKDFHDFPEWPIMAWGVGRIQATKEHFRKIGIRNMCKRILEEIPVFQEWKEIFREFIVRNPPRVNGLPATEQEFNQLKTELQEELTLEERIYFTTLRYMPTDPLLKAFQTREKRINKLLERCAQFLN